MKKVLFSHSYYYQLDKKQWEMGTPYPPLGTIYAASYLRENNFEVALFDVCLLSGPELIDQAIEKEQPEYLVLFDDGFNYLTKMCLTNMREASFEMMKVAQKKGIKTIVCSSDSTDHYENYLDNGADIVLLGEGELSLLETINALENRGQLADVKGLCFKQDGQLVNTGKRPVIKNIDDLPQPAWDLIDVSAYKKIWQKHGHTFALNIATTRGCPYKCNWCAKPIYGNRYNTRSPKRVVEEIKYLANNFGVTNYWMCDDIFGLKPGWVQEFRDELHSEKLSIRYKIQSRADLLLQEDNIDALVASGLYEVWIGAESGSQKVLDAMDKGTTIQQIKSATKLLQSKGVRVAFFLQLGYLDETKEDVDATIAVLLECMPDDIGVSVSYPLPGTKFYDIVKSQLSEKANWTDSDDLALMFKNTFNQEYYKTLHRYIHKLFRNAQAKKFIQINGYASSKGVKSLVKRIYYWPWLKFHSKKLKQLSNVG